MYRISNTAEMIILNAIQEFEKAHSEHVGWDVSFDFFPDPTTTEDEVMALVATLAIYLEIGGATSDTSIMGSFYFPPYMLERNQKDLATSVTKSLESLVARREQQLAEGYAELAKVEEPKKRRSRSTRR